MVLKSFSKINLSLSVNKKLKNGLHNIQSYYCLINLHDKIKITKIKSDRDIVKFTGKFSRNINKKNNSISKVLNILRHKKLISNYYSVEIKKKIPVFAGLGGGSSNAAFLTQHLLRKKYDKAILKILEQKVGSDFRLFFHKQGFLKDLRTIKDLNKKNLLYFLLVFPNIKCSTRYIYSKVRKYSKKLDYDSKKINTRSKFIKLLNNYDNDLQSIVEKRYLVIKKIINEIKQKKGCYFSRMTGSGSVCYGVFLNKKTAKAALKRIKQKFPNYWSTFAKTI